MRHGKKTKKFGLKTGPRRSFFRILANNLIQHEHIVTTEARAKALKSKVERLISHGKKQNISGLRLLLKQLPKTAAYKVYHEIAPRYIERKGGYTRIIKLSKPRKNDASKMVRLELV